MRIEITSEVPIVKTPRLMQLSGLFDVPLSERSSQSWTVDADLDFPWNVGLIVGPSGSGKSTLARRMFASQLVAAAGFDWPADKSIVDGFPQGMGIKEITGILSSIGFSSPPAWLRPYHCLSNGEQFRVTLARALASVEGIVCFDEFTSVVDRTVAQIGSAAVAKHIRRAGRQFVAVTCHRDVLDWLDPDWVIEMPSGEFSRRSLQGRPRIEIEVARVNHSAWQVFKAHHYLSASQNHSAICFVGWIAGRPAVYGSIISFPHAVSPAWREHRIVCLPDFQGVGIGNAMSEYLGSVFSNSDKPYMGITSNLSMIHHRLKSEKWEVKRNAQLEKKQRSEIIKPKLGLKTRSVNRMTWSFRYVGPRAPRADAMAFGIRLR